MGATEKSFTKIDGVPVYYMRNAPPRLDFATWYCTYSFYNKLVYWKRNTEWAANNYGNYGTITWMASAGFYVNKGGQHGAGTAMDLDRIRWSSGKISSPYYGHHATSSLTLRRRYYALDACCRRYFRWVLDGYYPGHADHIHADFAALPTKFSKSSTSDTRFIQAVCNNFNSAGISVDGVWGPNTQAAYDAATAKIGVTGDPFTSSTKTRLWCWEVVKHGFANKSFGSM
ncbi:MAG: hypothetical protein QNJ12_21750 [Ilumatobacter sp.]|uniref:hypothetical protein n=1 Tax=Ilumatobacter sp. TaxID=1967498 RepID=UPI00260DA41D|nr:hypothetical protein [Ilumatobacter sp.]MDJ0771426.1 hypothetical protein [Ilumatobacter sp.]